MLTLCRALCELPEMKKLLSRVAAGDTPVAAGGLSRAHQAHLIGALRRLTGRPVAVVCPDEAEAAALMADIAVWAGENPLSLPTRELTLHHVETLSREWEQARLLTLSRLHGGQAPIVVGPADAFLQRTLSRETLGQVLCVLKPGKALSPEELTARLTAGGYARSEQVEGVGQFARRGGIIDFYPPGEGPVRTEFFGDEIDTLSRFDPETQRRTGDIPQVTLLPVAEVLLSAAPGGAPGLLAAMEGLGQKASDSLKTTLRQDIERLRETGRLPAIDRYLPAVYPEGATAVSHFPRDTIFFFVEQGRLSERIQNHHWRQNQDIETLLETGILSPAMADFSLSETDFFRAVEPFARVTLDAILPGRSPLPPRAIVNIVAKQLPSYGGSLETAARDVRAYCAEGFAVAMLCVNQRQAARLQEMLAEAGLPAALDYGLLEPPAHGQVTIALGGLSAGLEYPALKLVVLSEGQLIAGAHRAKKPVRRDARGRVASYADLTPGDLVVHEHHGIGRFTGIVKMEVDKISRDYIHIAYGGGDGLYVPVTQLHLVSKYIGAGEDSPAKLHRLGGGEWQRAKSRAKAAAKDLAEGLVKLYAERKKNKGFAFPPDNDWQQGFEEAFEYIETDDQLRCAREIKADMELEIPMDRLLCGDVGFGKTEVALRAVMKCVLGGKQAAILVPTTVLAMQHFQTATRRFADYPVRMAVMSRFVPPAQLKETAAKLRAGELDLVVGTHKLLQKNIVFKDLGLLIIDEEQRFGVTHKERLKEMSRQVDALTLTATPIPRTLNMALSGIRDMSTIEGAPRDRYPVQTFVLEHEPSILLDAVRREIARGGQVYYLHNRVESIDKTAARLAASLPGVTVAVAHGQMDEETLGDVMRGTVEGRIQVLVCTTIIETGIDIPNVNTLIIEDAEKMGLAQLHQIRGRVGRSPRHAYAYLTFRPGKVLTEVATKRLTAIREFAEFGSGFKIAMRDLEIRGAGNVLGAEQSGHLMSVGYDMYLKLLEEAVLEQRGEQAPPPRDCVADLAVAAGIPESYVKSPGQRMDLYRRMAAVQTEEESADLLDELIDRFGDPPKSVAALLQVALLRAEAGAQGVSDISQKGERLLFSLRTPDIRRVAALCGDQAYRGRVLFGAGDTPHLSLRLPAGADVLAEARGFIRAYGADE